MNDMPRLSTPAQMVRQMADANGLDLSTLTRQGQITADEVSDITQSCARCASKGCCDDWLKAHHTPVETAPGFCRNKPWFDGLKEG